ncbi:flagellar protein FliT [Jeotgalibacillus sp. JSM ZJ347]|uniref:flagellar protein FliT n=1 Tax=Jeotgalibacillus sp. JSM ZJ347 TaxID=3342117 RepID=UPI0035A93B7C
MSLEVCYELTKALYTVVQSDEDRDTKIEQVEKLLEKRESILKDVKVPETPDEQKLANDIVTWNQKIDTAMQDLRLEIQKDIKKIGHKKKSAAKYNNPYAESETTDGVFYDKRN